jgi:hypothetical protein
MENFFNYIAKPVDFDDVEIWFRANNITYEKLELFSDFSLSLYYLMFTTYLGMDTNSNETKIVLTDDDDEKHFEWCWNKVLSNFKKESIEFTPNGEHYDYYLSFFKDTFYNKKENKLRDSIGEFFKDLFDIEKPFTKSDLDMILSMYKLLEKSIKSKKNH